MRVASSLWARLAVLLVVFLALPVMLYGVFLDAEEEKRTILIETVRDKGLIIGEALTPLLTRADGVPFVQLGSELARFGSDLVRIKLLYRPSGTGGQGGFFYVAAAPVVPVANLEAERKLLLDLGVLDRLGASCAGDLPLALRVKLPDGGDELLTSITPVQTSTGCWAVVISNDVRGVKGVVSGEPYWKSREVKLALAIYLAMALLVFLVFFSLWHSLRRFGQLAREIDSAGRAEDSFGARTTVPELAAVAKDFDRMVGTLRASAESIRRAAEDNAHAFKTPLGVIRQALEPIRRRLPEDDARAQTALEAVSASVTKLNGLVQSARRLDEVTADLLDLSTHRVDLSSLIVRIAEGYREVLGGDAARLIDKVEPGLFVMAREELIETMVENLIDNALSFSPPDGVVEIHLRARDGAVEIDVCDRGPGVPPDRIEKIFDRYYSDRPFRPEAPDDDSEGGFGQTGHFGIGLWLVRRHAEALKGAVAAANRQRGGLAVTITLPRVD